MDKNEEILKRLHSIPDKEWVNIVDSLTKYVYFKINGKTLFGAHSEQNLGVAPIEYYVDEAIAKLFSLEWKWQFEKFTLLEQLQRIVGSMVSTNVEKFRAKKIMETPFEGTELVNLAREENNTNDDELYDLFREALDECTKDDDELQLYVMAFDECSSFDEMSKELGFDKKKLYSIQQKLTRRVKKYFEIKKS